MLQVDCNKPDFNRLVDKLQEACKLKPVCEIFGCAGCFIYLRILTKYLKSLERSPNLHNLPQTLNRLEM